MIEFGQIDVRTKLADKVSDREPLISSLIEPRFLPRNQLKKMPIPFHDDVASAICQVKGLNQLSETRAFEMISKTPGEDLAECRAMNRHEKGSKIQLKRIDRPTTSLTELPYLLLEIFQCTVSSLPPPACEAGVDEFSLPNCCKSIDHQMMDNSVAEMGRENFTRLRMRDDETNYRGRPVFSCGKIAVELNEISTEVSFESSLVNTGALTESTVPICASNIFEGGPRAGILHPDRVALAAADVQCQLKNNTCGIFVGDSKRVRCRRNDRDGTLFRADFLSEFRDVKEVSGIPFIRIEPIISFVSTPIATPPGRGK